MVDTWDLTSRAKEHGGSTPFQGIILIMLIEKEIQYKSFNQISICLRSSESGCWIGRLFVLFADDITIL